MEQIKLTSLQKAKQKYYEKIKNNPNYILQRRQNCSKYYNEVKNNLEFKEKYQIINVNIIYKKKNNY